MGVFVFFFGFGRGGVGVRVHAIKDGNGCVHKLIFKILN